MSGSKTKNYGTFLHPKRAYLFGLLAVVLFLGLNFLFPASKPLKQTSVSIEFTHDGSDQSKNSTQQALLNELKTQLSVETLSQTLDSVRAKTEISSNLFLLTESQFDVESIRTKLIEGALSVERLNPSNSSANLTNSHGPHATENHHAGDHPEDHSLANHSPAKNTIPQTGISEPEQAAGFRLSILGSGTDDEWVFVKLLANKIKDAVAPDYDRDQIKLEIESIRDGMITASEMNKTLRNSVSETFDKYTRRQQQLLASASSPSAGTGAVESYELQRMRTAREQCIQEFRQNEKNGVDAKSEIQIGLKARIDSWMQEIQKQSGKEIDQYQRLANKDTGVERATFVDTGVSGIQPFELAQEVSSLKTEVALLVGKIDIASKQHSDNLEISSKLSKILSHGKESTVRVGEASQVSVWASPKSLLWTVLASVAISGVMVLRIRPSAFANHYADQKSIEDSLQIPVIDQVSLPTSSEKEETRIIVQQTQWVRMLTKTCEVVLLVGLVGIVCLLFVQSDSARQLLFQPSSFFQ